MKGREILTVSEITGRIAACLEEKFPEVWVQGEVGEFTAHSSGHWYFTLKDERSQLRAVMFKFQNRLLRFRPEEGQEVLCRGRVRAYLPRSMYQLEVEWMEPVGRGALYLKFEELKSRLAREGLFDPARKRPIPSPLKRLAIITSLSAAALQDMLRILRERDPSIEVLIIPASVQGETAAQELAHAVALANRPEVARPPDRRPLEAIIIGRGGGSLEDLWAFNEEVLARAIFASELPVISAVGHEIDFTIADLVADLRAPTPTAAAEIVSAGRPQRLERLYQHFERLHRALTNRLEVAHSALENVTHRLRDPGERIREAMIRTDEIMDRSLRALGQKLALAEERLNGDARSLLSRDPRQYLGVSLGRLDQLFARLQTGFKHQFLYRQQRLEKIGSALFALSPQATLARGFAIARDAEGKVIREAERMSPGDDLELILHQGRLECGVKAVKPGKPL